MIFFEKFIVHTCIFFKTFSFQNHDYQKLQISSNMSSAMRATYFGDIAPRLAREHHNLRPDMIQLVNDNDLFIVSHTDGNTTRATLL